MLHVRWTCSLARILHSSSSPCTCCSMRDRWIVSFKTRAKKASFESAGPVPIFISSSGSSVTSSIPVVFTRYFLTRRGAFKHARRPVGVLVFAVVAVSITLSLIVLLVFPAAFSSHAIGIFVTRVYKQSASHSHLECCKSAGSQ